LVSFVDLCVPFSPTFLNVIAFLSIFVQAF
jgi:hypothetical protein